MAKTRGLFLTCDDVGNENTGGGQVVTNEFAALTMFAGVASVVKPEPHPQGLDDPFYLDGTVLEKLRLAEDWIKEHNPLIHVYAGCFSKSLEYLKGLGCTITYTVAAHSVPASKKAHEDMGLPFGYRHLNDPYLFKEYIRGYVEIADVVICPSEYSARTVQEQGRKGRIQVIPHGFNPCQKPLRSKPPEVFTVGYLGAYGPDKGVPTLLKAFKDFLIQGGEGRLLLGGRDSQHPAIKEWCRGAGLPSDKVFALGWLDSPYDLYDACSVYVQPSNTEGFGIEVIEALSRGVPVVCSIGAGAVDHTFWKFPAGNAAELTRYLGHLTDHGVQGMNIENWVKDMTWPLIQGEYTKLWEEITS